MFSSSPLAKSCVGPENCSSGRNNASCRFPVGITSLGDENQHIRIQLAVNKYNSFANNSLSNRCIISPVRHSFLKNSLKAKDFEVEIERTLKREKRNGNQYEGVGDFPTIHLKKSAVRYRPIRRFNDVKIPYPELPVNRFLSHLPEVCTDLKSSTRSVLDVLEDLSGKKILIKEDNGSNKPKSKGLGGDYFSSPNAVYKPLFVQKPKVNSILTRDNTTQTFSLDIEVQSLHSNNSFIRNDASDSRAELRKKLAKQNNEIFASLSSSICSSFAVKRKREKVLRAKEDEKFTDVSLAKKSKISDDQLINDNENSASNFSGMFKINSNKLNRKNKPKETTSPASPNKDRLMTIFLDMQKTNPKIGIYNGNHSSDYVKSAENNSQAPIINGLKNKAGSVDQKESLETEIIETGDENISKNPSTLGVSEKATPVLELKKRESGQTSNALIQSPNGKREKAPNDILKSDSAVFQFDVNACNTINNSKIENESNLSDISQNNNVNENDREKNSSNCQVLEKSLTLGNSDDKPNFTCFKFGTENDNSLGTGVSPKDPRAQTLKAANISISSESPLRFAFASSSNATTFAPQTSSVKTNVTTAEENLFSFGKNASLRQQTYEIVKIEEKNKISNGVPPSVTGTTQIVQPNFDQKSNIDSSGKTIGEQTVSSVINPTSQLKNKSFSSNGIDRSTNPATVAENKNLFTFTQGIGTPVTSTALVTATQEPKFSFPFGKPQEAFDPKSSILFSFGQKSNSQESAQSISVLAKETSEGRPTSNKPTSIVKQTLEGTSNPSTTFGQSIASPMKSHSQAPSSVKSEAITFGNISSLSSMQNNTTFSIKSAFESTGFGSAATQASFSFGTSTSSASGFRFGEPATAQPTQACSVSSAATQSGQTFGISVATTQSGQTLGVSSAATQSGQTFGVSSATTQPTQTFGVSSATTQPTQTFGVSSTTTQPTQTFGVSSATTQPTQTFGVSSATTQPTQTFGVSSATTQPTQTFGVSFATTQPAQVFGVSSAIQNRHTFRTPTTSHTVSEFGNSCTIHSAPAFGVTTTTQPSSTFGNSSTTQSVPNFEVSTTSGSISTLGTSTLKPSFGVSSTSQSTSGFGTSTSQSALGFGIPSTQSTFGTSTEIGVVSSSQGNSAFGVPASSSTAVRFGTTTTQNSSTFGTSLCFSTAASTLPHTSFGVPVATSTSGFGTTQSSFSPSFNNKPTPSQTSNIFGQNLVPNFSSSTSFSSNQNNVFGHKTSAEENVFDRNKTQTPVFGGASQTFNSQGKLSFGVSTPNVTGFNTSPPNTSAASVFSFGGSSTSGSNNLQTPFAFKSPVNEPFKFGAGITKEGSGFGVSNSATFNFGTGQANSNTMSGSTSAFNFGGTQASNFTPFSFGTTPSPSAFSFGGSTSSASSGSGFNFGTSNPAPGGSFGQTSAASPAPTFPVPGTFCIGSGSSQSRPRATSRPRRRP